MGLFEIRFDLLRRRPRELQPDLEASPYRTIEEFGVIRGRDDDNVGGESVDLKKQRAHDSLDLAGLVDVAPLLLDGVEFVEEEHAAPRPHVLKQLVQPTGRLPQVARDESIVTRDQERDHQRMGQGFGKGSLAVPRLSGQKDAIPWLEVVGAEDGAAMLLFD